jgi:bifunctional N-acetylglucosamine-1-phosphate-uridyltransferase/glucosamine-1-phosphate-acetyltransferase GlmU-like protein
VDTVILAAGRGARLNGIAAPFHKPLLIVNGMPLIVQLVRAAHATFRGSDETARVVVVVAPENAQAISAVLSAHELFDVQYVLQPLAHGPGDALRRGLVAAQDGRTLVLMADNVISQATLERVVDEATPYAVGCVDMPPQDAARFTRYNWQTSGWDERVPVVDDHISKITNMVTCWVGPLIIDRAKALDELNCHLPGKLPGEEILIGPNLRFLIPSNVGYEMVEVDVTDIGLPEMWT